VRSVCVSLFFFFPAAVMTFSRVAEEEAPKKIDLTSREEKGALSKVARKSQRRQAGSLTFLEKCKRQKNVVRVRRVTSVRKGEGWRGLMRYLFER
jgi:hypothetical protein